MSDTEEEGLNLLRAMPASRAPRMIRVTSRSRDNNTELKSYLPATSERLKRVSDEKKHGLTFTARQRRELTEFSRGKFFFDRIFAGKEEIFGTKFLHSQLRGTGATIGPKSLLLPICLRTSDPKLEQGGMNDKTQRVDKVEKNEKIERLRKNSRIEKTEKNDKTNKNEKTEKAEKSEKNEKTEKTDRSMRTDRSTRIERIRLARTRIVEAPKRLALVFELSATLIQRKSGFCSSADMRFSLETSIGCERHSVNFRPYLSEVLARLSETFDLIIFTSCSKRFAENILAAIDPFGVFFKEKLFRESCVLDCKTGIYLKPPGALNRDPSTLVFVDSGLPPQKPPSVSLPILPYLGETKDEELLKFEAFLNRMTQKKDPLAFVRRFFCLEQLRESRSPENLEQNAHFLFKKMPLVEKQAQKENRDELFKQIFRLK